MTRETVGRPDRERRAPRTLPPYWFGAVGGALGALALLPLAGRIAEKLAAAPLLPGAERASHDVKEVTYAEAAVILLLVPAAAFFFGVVLPRLLARRAPAGSLSLEWPAIGFAGSWFLARHGVPDGYALAIALVLTLTIAAAVVAFRRRWRVRRLFARRVRDAWGVVIAAATALPLAAWARAATLPPASPGSTARVALCAAALLAVAATALAARRRPDAALARLRTPAAIAVLASAAALAVRQPRLVLLGPAAALAFVWAARKRDRLALARGAIAALAVVCAWRLLVPGAPSLDAFEDGHSLAGVQRYLAGAAPYAGMVPVHGWGADGGVDASFMRVFGATVDTFQARRGVWAVLALLALGSVSFGAFRSRVWGGAALLIALGICASGVIERQMLAFASLACLVTGAVRRSGAAWYAAAGALAGLELLHSLDYGLVVLVGGAVSLAALALTRDENGRRITRLRHVAAFLGAALAASLPFILRLAWLGSLGAFLRESFVVTPRWVAQAWGLPAGGVWRSLAAAAGSAGFVAVLGGTGVPAFFALAVLAAAATVLLVRSAVTGLDADDRAGLATLGVALVAMRVVLGRADEPHLERYSIFIAVPATWLLLRAWRSRSGVALFAVTAALLSLRLHPLAALARTVERIVYSDAANSEPFAHPPRAGGCWVPAPQAHWFQAFNGYVSSELRPTETFFDFDNQPALYFLADRLPPIRYSTVAEYESPERQREVVAALERVRPRLALLAYGFSGTLDIPNAERAPEVARYVAAHYGEPCLLGGWLIARRLERERAAADVSNPPPCAVPAP